MEDNLKGILENFQKGDCTVVSIMQSVMKFFKYEATKEWYFAMGNGRVLTLPFSINKKEYLRGMFAYINDICCFSGAWYFDFLTEDSKGFVKKLKEKWYEWADMWQAMPILVGLESKEYNDVGMYVMVGHDKEIDSFEFMDGDGKLIFIPSNTLITKYSYMGFATIDVPYNFMVKSSHYRSVKSASVRLTRRIGFFLKNAETMQKYLEALYQAAYTQDVGEIKCDKLLHDLYENLGTIGISVDLLRNSYGKFLKENGYEELGNAYENLGKAWTKIADSYFKDRSVKYSLLTQTVQKELELIENQKGWE